MDAPATGTGSLLESTGGSWIARQACTRSLRHCEASVSQEIVGQEGIVEPLDFEGEALVDVVEKSRCEDEVHLKDFAQQKALGFVA